VDDRLTAFWLAVFPRENPSVTFSLQLIPFPQNSQLGRTDVDVLSVNEIASAAECVACRALRAPNVKNV